MAPLRHPARAVLVTAALVALLGAAALGVRTDNTPAAWLPEHSPERTAYLEFRERFGGDTFALVAVRLAAEGEHPAPGWEARLLALADALRAAPGVVEVRAPVAPGGLAAQARAELPQTLATLDAAVAAARARAPERPDEAPWLELELLRAEAHATLPALLLAPDDPAALASARVAQAAGLAALERFAPELSAALAAGEPPAGQPRAAALGALHAWAVGRLSEVRAAPDPRGIADLGRVDAALELVARGAALGDRELAGAAALLLAVRAATAPPASRDLARAATAFERAMAFTPGALLPRVLRARHLAPALAATPAGAPLAEVLAAQERAWQAFAAPLREVLAAPLDAAAPPRRALADAVAREQAAALLADPGAAGVIPPEGAEGAAPPAAPAAHVPAHALAEALLGPEGRWAGLLVLPEPDLDPAARAATIEGIEATLAAAAPGEAHLVGPEALTHDLDVASRRSFGGLFPLVALLLGAVLAASLREPRIVLGVLATAGAAAVASVGLLAASGHALNLIVVVLPAIVLVLTTCYALHLVTRFLALPPLAAHDLPIRAHAWARAARETLGPCALTALTTAAGFGSLVTSRIPPVRELGLFAGAGALIAFALSFTLLPCLLALSRAVLPRGPQAAGAFTAPRTAAAAAALARGAPAILLAAGVVALLALAGVQRLHTESHVLSFFPPGHRQPLGYAAVEPGLIGLTPLELWLEGPPERVLAPAALQAFDRFADAAAGAAGGARVISPLRDPRLADASYAVRAALLEARLARGAPDDGGYVARAPDGAVALRATIACRTASSDAFHALVEALRADVPPELRGEGARLRLTGAVPLLVQVQVLLVETQVSSFALALVVVSLMLATIYRSPGLLLISLVPNLLPVAITLGAMGWLGIPLDTATVTVAGIALGLITDDTIHLLHHMQASARGGVGPREGVAHALRVVGLPVATTTVAVAVGFGAFGISEFMPTRAFGGLIALTCVAALACDLVVLPALVIVTGRNRGEPGSGADPD